eukprot:5417886-Pyramimonas_sp.AAC.1
MKLVFYNPLAASTTDRLEDIISALREWGVVVLTGTRQWARLEQMKKTKHRHHVALQFGAKRGQLITKARGTTFSVSNDM